MFKEVLLLDASFHRLTLTRGRFHLLLPDWLARKQSIINPQNEEEKCFQRAVIAALEWTNIKSHPQYISQLRKFADNYNWSGLEFPVSVKDIKTFEVNNNISINVLAAEGKEIYIQRKSEYKYDREINLFMVSEDGKRHYTAIKSLSRLLGCKNSGHHGKQYFSTNCLQGFKLELSRDKCQVYCEDNETVRVEMPN